jgi:integrase
MKSRTGYVYFDEDRRRWVARLTYTDPDTGRRVQRKAHALTKTEARDKLDGLRAKLKEQGERAVTSEQNTFAELAREYERQRLIPAEYVGDKKVAGRRDLATPKGWLKRLKVHFGDWKLSAIRRADIEDYKLKLLRLPTQAGGARSITAVNREMEFLRAVLNYAVENGRLARSPFTVVRGRPLIEKALETKRERFPTFGEEMALLAACTREGQGGNAHLRAVLIVAADTGLRRREMFTLMPDDLDFIHGVINVRAKNAKTNRPRRIPMTPRVKDELLKLSEGKRHEPVFGYERVRREVASAGQPEVAAACLTNVKRSFSTACREAQISDLHLHDFRHSFVTRAILAGVPPAVVLSATGHASEEWRRYLNVGPEHMRRLLLPHDGQGAEEVRAYAREVCRGLRAALRYDELAALLADANADTPRGHTEIVSRAQAGTVGF